MARTKSDNFEEIRATILKTAAKLFASKGFRNTNIIDIGEACNSSKSRMYHYFPSKEDMLEEMLLQHIHGLEKIVKRIAESDGDPKQLFIEYVSVHLQYYEEYKDCHTVLIEDVEYVGPEAKIKIREIQSKLVSYLSSLLQRVSPDKFSEKHIASAQAMLIYGMLNWTYTWFKPTGRLSLKMLAEQAADFCLNGLNSEAS